MSQPLARSPIRPSDPLTVLAGWEVSARRATGALTLTDCTPLTKIQIKAPVTGTVAAAIGVPFGRARKNEADVLVVGSGPGEWLLIGSPGQAADLAASVADVVGPAETTGPAETNGHAETDGHAPGDYASSTDLTHGRALIRLTGPSSADLLSTMCGIDLSDAATPDGAAFRSSVAALATDVVRDDVSGVRSYLLHCERSSGQYLFDTLLSAGRDLGIEIDGFTP
ncbi:MAG: hypothetical protein LBV34_25670 [Nocardiopsaceae bacterium]|nr:hypothetical protein [Nocardiopsaceae bacterium]